MIEELFRLSLVPGQAIETCAFCTEDGKFMVYDSVKKDIYLTCTPKGFEGCRNG